MRVFDRFFGIWDLAHFKIGIREFGGKGERDNFRIVVMNGTRDLAIQEMLL